MATLDSTAIIAKINAGEVVLLNCNNTLIQVNEVGDIPSVLADCGFKEASLSEFTINGAPANGQSLIYNSTTNRLEWVTPAGADAISSVFGRTGAVVAATDDYTWAQINKTSSSLADIAVRSASDLTSGTLPDGRFPVTLPTLIGINLTGLNASNLGSGTVPLARLSGITTSELSATAGITSAQLAGSIALSKLSITGTPDGTKYLRDDGSWQTVAGGGGTSINSTNGQVPYRVNSTTFGDSAISSNALNATGISVTSAAAGSGVTVGVTSSGSNEGVTITPKGTSDLRINNTGYQRPLSIENPSGGGYVSFFRSSAIIGGIGGTAMWLGSGSSTDLAIGSLNALNFYTNNSLTQAMILDTSNRLVIGTNGSANAQLSVYSQDPTRPALKLNMPSGTSDSQEAFGVYNNGTKNFSVLAGGAVAWGSSADVLLERDAANTLAQRNGTNVQAFRVYNTYTDASNYQRIGIYGQNASYSNAATITTENAGTGAAQNLAINAGGILRFSTGASFRWDITSGGHLLAVTDNTYDVGASGVTRPRNVYVGTDIFAGGNINATFNIRGVALYALTTAGATTGAGFASATDGVLRLTNYAATDFTRLQFGGTTSSFPALKRSTTSLQVRLADDSDDAPLTVLTVKTKALTVATLPAAATAGAGARAFVTDANATTYFSTVAGGGSNALTVFSDGTNWKIG